jgi:RNA polymerase sigma-70 factor (ECF subfamily)
MDVSLPVTLSDESLLAGLASGDPQSAAAFVRRFQSRVYGLAYTILGDRGAAEEAAQEAFVRAWRHGDAYDRRRGSVVTWLLTIARNVSIDMARMRRADPVDPATLLSLPLADEDAEARQMVAHDVSQLVDELRRLPEQQKRALVLAAFYGRTGQEIADLEDAPLGTIKTRIRTAMLKLRAALESKDE